MKQPHDGMPGATRRDFLTTAAGMAALAGAGAAVGHPAQAETVPGQAQPPTSAVEPFRGAHQSGIVTFPIQHHTYFAAFDLVTEKRDDVIKLLKSWTEASARMMTGDTAQPLGNGLTLPVPLRPAKPGDEESLPNFKAMSSDSGETIGMSPSRLTITFGFGAGLFLKDGHDRFGLAKRRPAAFVDLPKFAGDQMIENRTGGDISVQACAEDPQVAFHAVRQLARIAEGVAQLRWVQTGFRPGTGERHLLGFSNGKGNPPMTNGEMMDKVVWVGDEGPDWMRGGSYLVARRIRFALEHWDHMPVAYQEKAIGEMKYQHGPAPKPADSDEPDYENDGDPTHLDIATPDAFTMVRRSFSYNDGLSIVAERWPPWRQGLEYDAGMLFICYQRDPRTGFINMYDKMARLDVKLNQFWTHEGGGLFACPRGAKDGEFIGQYLFQSL